MARSSRRRRFGISIPEDMANELDQLSSRLEIDRSSIVETALREYIHDQLYNLIEHKCTGLIVIIGSVKHGSLSSVMEEYRDIVSMYNHVHAGNQCIETIVVSGLSSRVVELYKALSSLGCRVRYIPISFSSLEKE